MHDIEPFFKWLPKYSASKDRRSPFYGRQNSELYFTDKVYNYLIHPQWDGFGSETLYIKILFADYDQQFVIIECMGEWNDSVENDIMHLMQEVIDPLIEEGISKFLFLGDNLLNAFFTEDDYYMEWQQNIQEEQGWISILNLRGHIMDEMDGAQLGYYIHYGETYNNLFWQKLTPLNLFLAIETLVNQENKRLN